MEQWREPSLSKMSIPLGPQRGVLVGQVHRIHDSTALPAAVAGRNRSLRRIRAAWDVAQPRAFDVKRIDVEQQP
jgi:hypothetical protein